MKGNEIEIKMSLEKRLKESKEKRKKKEGNVKGKWKKYGNEIMKNKDEK